MKRRWSLREKQRNAFASQIPSMDRVFFIFFVGIDRDSQPGNEKTERQP